MHPIAGESITRRMRLSDLILMVRELQIQATGVDIKLRAQIFRRHRRALQVPPRTATAPRSIPTRLPRLRSLPQREVTRIALTRSCGFALIHLVELLARQGTIIRQRHRTQVHVSVHGVAMASVDNPLHVLDHFRNMPRRMRLQRRRRHAQLIVGPLELALIRRRPLPPGTIVLRGLVQNFVIDISDVPDKRHVKAHVGQPITQNIESHARTQVANMRRRLHCRTTQIHRRMPLAEGNKIT